MSAPVQTERTSSASAAVSLTQRSRTSLFIWARVPKPPGTTRMSGCGQVSKECVGKTSRPLRAAIEPLSWATVKTSKGSVPSRRPVTEKISNGPAKSSTSTSSKSSTATFRPVVTNGSYPATARDRGSWKPDRLHGDESAHRRCRLWHLRHHRRAGAAPPRPPRHGAGSLGHAGSRGRQYRHQPHRAARIRSRRDLCRAGRAVARVVAGMEPALVCRRPSAALPRHGSADRAPRRDGAGRVRARQLPSPALPRSLTGATRRRRAGATLPRLESELRRRLLPRRGRLRRERRRGLGAGR